MTDSPAHAGGFLLVIMSTGCHHQCVVLHRVDVPHNGTTFQLGIPPHPNRFLSRTQTNDLLIITSVHLLFATISYR